MKPLQLKARMMPATRHTDGSVTIKVRTDEEVNSDGLAAIDEYRQQSGYFMFRPNKFNAADIPTDDTEGGELRSPSDTLRRSFYKLFMMQGGKKENFPPWYRENMAVFQKVVGDKIEALENSGNGS